MRRSCNFLIGLFLILALSQNAYAQTDSTQGDYSRKILLLNLDSIQFYSEVNFKDYIYGVDTVDILEVARIYSTSVGNAIDYYSNQRRYYQLLGKKELNDIRRESRYMTLKNDEGDEYLAMVPLDTVQSALRAAVSIHQPDYILSINLYEILPHETEKDKFYHILHYDLFTADLKMVKSGRFIAEDYNLFPQDLSWLYNEFALDMIFWTESFEKSGVTGDFEVYDSLRNEHKNPTPKLKKYYGGLAAGFGGPYGGIGAEFMMLQEYFDLNAGLGYDYMGFKIGFGFRTYLIDTRRHSRIFGGINIAYNSGNTFVLGARYDENNVLINPDDISKYKTGSDVSIHFRAGIANFTTDIGMMSFTLGYSKAMRGTGVVKTQGDDRVIRDAWADFLGPGGLEISIGMMF